MKKNTSNHHTLPTTTNPNKYKSIARNYLNQIDINEIPCTIKNMGWNNLQYIARARIKFRIYELYLRENEDAHALWSFAGASANLYKFGMSMEEFQKIA